MSLCLHNFDFDQLCFSSNVLLCVLNLCSVVLVINVEKTRFVIIFILSPKEKMRIPSVVIEPASSNEGDDDRDGDITSPIESSGNGVIPECQTTKDASGMPYGFLFKVSGCSNRTLIKKRSCIDVLMCLAFLQAETLHDFEAANPDELALKKGDIVLVVPTVHAEDQVRFILMV